ncbi:MAG TPA: TadE/TadG family type IV pilus assembly protein [Actinomycetes bacterium]|nr:TadE/TadG family type IV pilus assembly protein [Actinomycetes bacterium]
MPSTVRQGRSTVDRGAAAVEFALLIPIFVMLTFGMLSAGLAFWHNIALTQGARDAARLGATYPIGTETNEKPMPDWLQMVANTAAAEAGWDITGGTDPDNLDAGDLDGSGENGFVCAAFVAGTVSGSSGLASDSLYFGRAGNLPSGVSSTQCYSDGRAEDRVQVRIHREAGFNAIFVSTTWDLNSRSSILYERG